MKHKKQLTLLTTLILLFSLLVACNANTAEPANNSQQLPPTATTIPAPSKPIYCNTTQPLEACADQTVKVTGLESQLVLQHPLMNGPDQHQQYLDVEEQQLVLLTADLISCPANIEVVGTLDLVEMECAEGSQGKCNYTNYFLTVTEWHCK